MTIKTPNSAQLAAALLLVGAVIVSIALYAGPIGAVPAHAEQGTSCRAIGTYGYTSFGTILPGNALGFPPGAASTNGTVTIDRNGQVTIVEAEMIDGVLISPSSYVCRYPHGQSRLHLRSHAATSTGTGLCWRRGRPWQPSSSHDHDPRRADQLCIHGQSTSGKELPVTEGRDQTPMNEMKSIEPVPPLRRAVPPVEMQPPEATINIINHA